MEQRVVAHKTKRLYIAARHFSLVEPDVAHRLDAARRVAASIGKLFYWRFFHPKLDDSAAFGRVLDFKATPAELGALQAELYGLLRERIIQADRKADDSRSETVPVSVSFSFSRFPPNAAWKTPKRFA